MIIIWSLGAGDLCKKIKLIRYKRHVLISVCIIICCVCIKTVKSGASYKECLQYIDNYINDKGNDVHIYWPYKNVYLYYKDTGLIANRHDWNLFNEGIDNNLSSQWLSTQKGKIWFCFTPSEEFRILDFLDQHALLDSLGYKKLDEYKNKKIHAYLYDCGE